MGVFADRNISGGVLKRPGLDKAIASLGKGDILVVDSHDRLARDLLIGLTIQHRVATAGATIAYADGTPPASTPEGELVGNILSAFAQYQRQLIRRRTKIGLARKKQNGEYLGRAPLGWGRRDGKLVRDPKYAAVLDFAIDKYNLGKSFSEITLDIQKKYARIGLERVDERTISKMIKKLLLEESDNDA